MTLPSPLISAQELLDLLGQPQVKVFDVRGTWSTPARSLPDDYAAGHIPGAVFLDWTRTFLEAGVELGLADIADIDGARKSFKALGINEGDLVFLYDDYHHMQAGRVWWAMRHWGFDNVRVLDGGWKHWTAKSFLQSTDIAFASDGSFEPAANTHLRVDTEDFLKVKESSCLLDARGSASYAGYEDDPRSGHIPGALSIPFGSVLNQDTGCFLSDEDLRRVFQDAAPGWNERNVISSCGSGYAGTVLMLALEKLGVPSTLYDGSISAWKQDPNRPLTQGTSP